MPYSLDNGKWYIICSLSSGASGGRYSKENELPGGIWLFRASDFEVRVACSGFRSSRLVFRVSGFVFRVSGSFGCKVPCFVSRVPGFEFRVLCRVSGSTSNIRFRVSGSGFRDPGSGSSVEGRGLRVNGEAALEATQGQIDGFFSHLPYKCHLEEVASVGDRLKICPQLDSRVVHLERPR